MGHNFLKKMIAAVTSGVLAISALPISISMLAVAEDVQRSDNELGESDFNSGKGLPWHVCESMTGKMKFDISNGTYNITIVNPGGTGNGGEDRWDCQFRHRGLTIEEGHTYRITYSVKPSNSGHMYAKIGNMADDDQELWHGNGKLLNMPTLDNDATEADVISSLKDADYTGSEVYYYQGWNTWSSDTIPADKWTTYAYEFTYAEQSGSYQGGVSSDHWKGTVSGTAEFTFHMGGKGQYTPSECFPAGTEIQFDNMALIDLTDSESNYPITPAYERNKILVNQVGYVAGLDKKATLVVDEGDDTPKSFKIVSTKTGKTVYTGTTTPKGADSDSGDYVQIIDFSDFNTLGTVTGESNTNTGAYYIECDGAKSYSFNIGKASSSSSNSVFSGMLKDSLNYFYQNRSGIPIESEYISSGDKTMLAHAEGHNPDVAYIQNDWINAYKGDGSDIQKDNGTLDLTGGWYDAGDHGKYVVNGGLSVWTLQNMYERAKLVANDTSKYDDGALNIPESGNGYPDLLDEARYEMEFMLKMQRDDGMVYHKVQDYKWTGLAVAPADDPNDRIVKPVSTCATLNLAAAGAQSYRLWKGIDDDYANQCLSQAEKAYAAAKENPEMWAPMDQAIGGGAYGDDYAGDDFYWAACELYTATGDSSYYTDLKSYKNTCDGAPDDDKAFSVTTSLYGGENKGSKTSFTWGSTAALGTLTLALHQDDLTISEAKQVRDNITKAADEYISIENEQGYGIPYSTTTFTDDINAPGEVFNGYEWGSNSMVASNAIIMAYAADNNKDDADKYASGVSTAMDYLFGRNAGEYSYITGYGDHATQYVHHRYWSGLIDSSFPYAPDGVMSGGPNSGMQDPWIRGAGYKPGTLAPQLCYLD
ncbi:MAG: glycoside hydrolase family 9 protein, partial [Oscillospiraceae bacterium]